MYAVVADPSASVMSSLANSDSRSPGAFVVRVWVPASTRNRLDGKTGDRPSASWRSPIQASTGPASVSRSTSRSEAPVAGGSGRVVEDHRRCRHPGRRTSGRQRPRSRPGPWSRGRSPGRIGSSREHVDRCGCPTGPRCRRDTDPVAKSVRAGSGTPSRYTSTSGATVGEPRRSGGWRRGHGPVTDGRLAPATAPSRRPATAHRRRRASTAAPSTASTRASYIPTGCQTVLISRNAAIHSGRWARASSSQSKSSAPTARRSRDAFHVLDRGLLQPDPQVGGHAEGIDGVDIHVAGQPGHQLRPTARDDVDDATRHIARGQDLGQRDGGQRPRLGCQHDRGVATHHDRRESRHQPQQRRTTRAR